MHLQHRSQAQLAAGCRSLRQAAVYQISTPTKGLPQKDCYVNILRIALAVDTLDPCGLYFGTTGGQVYASADSGDSWMAVVHELPAVYSVEVQALP